jgi:hypothetical protein
MTDDTGSGPPTHIAFSDETHYGVGQYRGIGLVTLNYSLYGNLNTELKNILKETHVKELKWQKLDARNDCQAALQFVECAVNNACAGSLRIDVLIWDVQDSRHKVIGRDDLANMHRMYYHLFKYVLIERWPNGSIWRLHPDEQASIDWSEISRFLDMASITVGTPDLLSGLVESFITEFNIVHVKQCTSEKEPLIQLADLFAGMGVYSRNRYARYLCWQLEHREERQITLLPDAPTNIRLSNADKMRCPVLDKLDSLCKKNKLGVGLKKSKGLKTHNPANPINFWWYQPQREEDKAPIRGRQ